MVKVGIVGVSGYSGFTALLLLLKHPHVRVTYVAANHTKGKVSEIWPQLAGLTELVCSEYSLKKAVALCDVVFLAVPHTSSLKITPALLTANKKVIDLSSDYRLTKPAVFKKWYASEHTDTRNLKQAVYGLPEFLRQEIKGAKLVANPGCYPTAALLALMPIALTHPHLVKSVIIDAKSGVSGAGRKATLPLSYCEVNENFKAYKVLHHHHAPEIEQYLSRMAEHPVKIDFVPHLIPVNRGILETIYIRLPNKIRFNVLYKLYKNFYAREKFVRLMPLGVQPELRHVAGTNFCDIGLTLNDAGTLLVITSAIDNLLKGAAGQAVQNMNLMYNFDEVEGLL